MHWKVTREKLQWDATFRATVLLTLLASALASALATNYETQGECDESLAEFFSYDNVYVVLCYAWAVSAELAH